MIRSHASAVMSRTGVNDSMPALVTRISTGPSSAADLRRTPASTDAAVGDVDLDGRAASPAGRASSAAAASAAAPLRSRRATRWPSAASCRATPRPMPDAPPVTTATRLIGAASTGVELEVQLA